ncbi:hypothetical protein B0H19DRAFT_1350218 [Mycena capillaripes]|nr:hypothetical protein B0H19DRAFT_1350218 [Mycena capillaripes]
MYRSQEAHPGRKELESHTTSRGGGDSADTLLDSATWLLRLSRKVAIHLALAAVWSRELENRFIFSLENQKTVSLLITTITTTFATTFNATRSLSVSTQSIPGFNLSRYNLSNPPDRSNAWQNSLDYARGSLYFLPSVAGTTNNLGSKSLDVGHPMSRDAMGGYPGVAAVPRIPRLPQLDDIERLACGTSSKWRDGEVTSHGNRRMSAPIIETLNRDDKGRRNEGNKAGDSGKECTRQTSAILERKEDPISLHGTVEIAEMIAATNTGYLADADWPTNSEQKGLPARLSKAASTTTWLEGRWNKVHRSHGLLEPIQDHTMEIFALGSSLGDGTLAINACRNGVGGLLRETSRLQGELGDVSDQLYPIRRWLKEPELRSVQMKEAANIAEIRMYEDALTQHMWDREDSCSRALDKVISSRGGTVEFLREDLQQARMRVEDEAKRKEKPFMLLLTKKQKAAMERINAACQRPRRPGPDVQSADAASHWRGFHAGVGSRRQTTRRGCTGNVAGSSRWLEATGGMAWEALFRDESNDLQGIAGCFDTDKLEV